ncbi:MAG TPA: hypothetical protein VLJ68_08330 [Chitinophagaceae bacterium]|nr:hypothetical protein [Chitinophagaceae bacterium]
MRKFTFFSAVFYLFLQVPASITWAQTDTPTGVVFTTHRVKIPFSTPDGKITIMLPDDIRPGDMISGTVSMEPEGRNEKTRNEHLGRLKKHQLSFDDGPTGKIEIKTSSQQRINLDEKGVTIEIPQSAGNLNLTNPEGKLVSKAVIPVLASWPGSEQEPKEEVTFWYGSYNPGIELEKKVMLDDEPLVVFTNRLSVAGLSRRSTPALKWFLNRGNNETSLSTSCSSPGKTILNIPPGATGPCQVVAKDNKDHVVFTDNINVLRLDASLAKSNLKRGERTELHVQVVGLEGCSYPVYTTIVNQSNSVVTLDKGNHQTHAYNPMDQGGNSSKLDIHQGVTGITTGDYNITANLILPAIAYGDIFQQQKAALKTTEDYNAWVAAIKKDLQGYADKQGNDELGRAAKAKVQRAIGNLPNCIDKNKLDEYKAFADAYLRSVDIPRGAATMWVCSFEAYKAAMKSIASNLSGNPQLIDWEVIKNGIEFLRHMGEQLKDGDLSKKAREAKRMAEGIQNAGETNENLQQLKEKLEEVNGNAYGRIGQDENMLRDYKLDDLIVSSFSNNLTHVSETAVTGPVLIPVSLPADSNRARAMFDNYGRDESHSEVFKDSNPGTYHVILTNMLGNIRASNYVANEIAGNPCNPEGAKTVSWLYIEKPCRVEMKTTRAENVSPDSEEFLDEIADLLGEISEAGAKMGTRLAKTFSITKSFAIWIEVVRDWESYKAEYVCKNGVWQHGPMTLVNKGTKQVTYWEKLTDESGQSAWTSDDDMGWIRRKANELKDKACK